MPLGLSARDRFLIKLRLAGAPCAKAEDYIRLSQLWTALRLSEIDSQFASDPKRSWSSLDFSDELSPFELSAADVATLRGLISIRDGDPAPMTFGFAQAVAPILERIAAMS